MNIQTDLEQAKKFSAIPITLQVLFQLSMASMFICSMLASISEHLVSETEGDHSDRHWWRYLGLVEQILQDLMILYPGWRMRIYHNVTKDQEDQAQYLCQLHCQHHLLDLCDVRTIPELVKHQVKISNKGSIRVLLEKGWVTMLMTTNKFF